MLLKLKKMVNPSDDWHVYSIPSKVILQRRREFYGLRRKKYEPIDKWLNRILNSINCCKFSSFMETLLIDRFICGLDAAELKIVQCVNTWTFKQLTEFISNQKNRKNGHKNTIIVENIIQNHTITALDIVKSVNIFRISEFNSVKYITVLFVCLFTLVRIMTMQIQTWVRIVKLRMKKIHLLKRKITPI